MGIYVCEIYQHCDDLVRPEWYANDCLGFEPADIVQFVTDDGSTIGSAFCQFKDTKKPLKQKIYQFFGAGNWRRVQFVPSIIPCPVPEEFVGLGPDELPPVEPDERDETIGLALCLEKIEQWQRNPRFRFDRGVSKSEKAFLRSLASLGGERIRSALSKQRFGKRGGVGTRFLNAASNFIIKAAINQILKTRNYKGIHFARKGSHVALCFTTQRNRTHFISGIGYRTLLRRLALERRSLS